MSRRPGRFHEGEGWHWRRSRGLRQHLFIWLAVTIVVTAVTVGLVFRIGAKGKPFGWDWDSARELVSERFERAWDNPADRAHFATGLGRVANAGVKITDAQGQAVFATGPECSGSTLEMPVQRGGETLGNVTLCFAEGRGHFAGTGVVALLVALSVLWGAAAVAARRITRPLSQLIAVTREMGSGNLAARVRLGRHGSGELKVLADSVNEMGRRIERQLKEQRELLAVVSHEVRSPLARIRVCSELLRSDATDSASTTQALDTLEQEVAEVDALLGKLLAHSRLDFEALSKSKVRPRQLMSHAITRHGLAPETLDDSTGQIEINVDVTLVARALDNLLENAKRYAPGPITCSLRLARPGERVFGDGPSDGKAGVVFQVQDQGPGFTAEALPRIFDAFYRTGETHGAAAAGLGLGLSLVKRIAVAHGGTAWAHNRPEGGACVAFSVALDPQPAHTSQP